MAPPDPAEIARAAAVLRTGGLVAFPTETVYGLGADAASPPALHRLYAVKGRPAGHPVIVHVAGAAALDDLARGVTDLARQLAAELWPGPLTLVVRRRPERIAAEATGGRDTVGLRVPDHPVALALLEAFGGPVAAPSANRFGRVSPTTAQHVLHDLGPDVDMALDGGACAVGVESTIVDCSGSSEPVVLRVGGVSAERLARVVGRPLAVRDDGAIAAPGTLPSHYAPRARVEIVDASSLAARAGAHLGARRLPAVLGLRDEVAAAGDLPGGVLALEPPADAASYARVLYARLREADAAGADVVLVVPPPPEGVGAAVADRLRRAAG